MKVTLLAFNGLMLGEYEIPDGRIVPRIYLIMDQPAPRICSIKEFAEDDTLHMKKATFEYESSFFIGRNQKEKHYYKLVDIR
jgi:hypothetical protein